MLTAWPIRGDCVPQENGGNLSLTALFNHNVTKTLSFNTSHFTVSLEMYTDAKDNEKYSLFERQSLSVNIPVFYFPGNICARTPVKTE